MYRVNYCETDPQGENEITLTSTQDFGSLSDIPDALAYIGKIMEHVMGGEGKPTITIILLRDEQGQD